MILCFFFDAVCCFCSRMFSRHTFNRLVSKTKSSLPAPSTSQSARLLQDWPMHPCLILHYSQRLQTMLRRMLVTRRLLHVKGDVMCTVLLLVLFCFLLYARHVRMEVALFAVHVVSLLLFGLKEKSNSVFKQHLCFQVVLSTGWDRPVWKLHIHGSTSPSRTLLGATGAKVGQDFQGVWPDIGYTCWYEGVGIIAASLMALLKQILFKGLYCQRYIQKICFLRYSIETEI